MDGWRREMIRLLWFLGCGFALGVSEALLIYHDRFLGLGGWYGYAANLGFVYALTFGLIFYLISLPFGDRGRTRTFYVCASVLSVILAARVYRIHHGKLVDLPVYVFLGLILASVVLFSSITLDRRHRWIGFLPFAGVSGFYLAAILLASPNPDFSAAGAGSPPSVVWITADTLRSDHLVQYGDREDVFEAFAEWEGDFVRFNRSYSTSSWTAPSVASHLTSLYPLQHGKSKGALMNKNIVTLPQILGRLGYRTIGISNQPLVSPGWGFGKGFDRFYATATVFQESTLIDILNEFWLEETMVRYTNRMNLFFNRFQATTQTPRGLLNTYRRVMRSSPEKPFFLYLYFFDPHAPYNPDPKWYPEGTESLMQTDYFLHGEHAKPEGEPADTVVREIERRYDGEINDVGDKVDRILEDLERRGLYEDSLILFTSDHGEKFYDHGEWLHGGPLYQEVTRVPLFLKLPDGTAGGRATSVPVDGVDLLPTVLEVLNVSVELNYSLEGESLVHGDSIVRRTAPPLMELIGDAGKNYQAATVKGNRKYFVFENEGTFRREAYRLRGPRRMDRSRIDRPDTRVFRRLEDRAGNHRNFPYAPDRIGHSRREQLKALGYLE